MEIKDWMIAGAVTVLGAAITVGVYQNKVSGLETRTSALESFKDQTTEKLGKMDGKLDTILNLLKNQLGG